MCVGAALYRKLRAYLMTEEQLQEHNYPRASTESSGRAVIHNQPERKAPADGEEPSSTLPLPLPPPPTLPLTPHPNP